jgi:CheY-like chemotaxis protein/anti-sigma regulatory factor (Ser/Thr protein kinase)
MQVLIADDEPAILTFLQEVLQSHGFEVLRAKNGQEALELYSKHRPEFTLTDIMMPGMNGLDLLRQIRDLNQEAAVILMTGAGTEAYAVEALRGGAINYFHKPIDINELTSTLNRYAALAAGFDYENYAAEFLEKEVIHIKLRNDITHANHVVSLVVNRCRSIFPLSELFTLRFGLYEMIINAIEHGNLGITYDEKSAALEDDRLNELIATRCVEPHRAELYVRVECEISSTGLKCIISDEGTGFDHQRYAKLDDPTALFEEIGSSLHGRGILLTTLQFDSVQFNDVGNQVTIIKRNAKGIAG